MTVQAVLASLGGSSVLAYVMFDLISHRFAHRYDGQSVSLWDNQCKVLNAEHHVLYLFRNK